jgi:hypothetical protein
MSIVQRILASSADQGLRPPVTYRNPNEPLIHIIRGFLEERPAEALRRHLIQRIASGAGEFEKSWAATRYQIFNEDRVIALSSRAQAIVEQVSGEKVAFSYNYTAIYPDDCELTPHRDRKGCEYNFLLYLGTGVGGDGATSIIELQTAAGWHEYRGRPGDALLFEGRKTLHARRGARPTTDFTTTLLHYTPVEYPFSSPVPVA